MLERNSELPRHVDQLIRSYEADCTKIRTRLLEQYPEFDRSCRGEQGNYKMKPGSSRTGSRKRVSGE